MIKILTVLISLCLAGCTYAPSPVSTLPKDYGDYVVRVSLVVKDQISLVATAWALDSNTLITAAHFCIPALEAQIFDDGFIKVGSRTAVIKKISSQHDICSLSVPMHLMKTLPVTSKKFEKRTPVLIVGVPLGLVKAHYTGEVTGYDIMQSIPILKDKMVVSVPTVGGISGSPCIIDGQAAGILVMGVPAFHHISFCEPGENIIEFLEE